MNDRVWVLLAGTALALGTSFASAHHSFAAVYDMQQAVTVKGTIVAGAPHESAFVVLPRRQERRRRDRALGVRSRHAERHDPQRLQGQRHQAGRRGHDHGLPRQGSRRRTWACCASSSWPTAPCSDCSGRRKGRSALDRAQPEDSMTRQSHGAPRSPRRDGACVIGGSPSAHRTRELEAAGPAPRMADGHPDLSGVWWGGADVGGRGRDARPRRAARSATP